MSGGSIGEGAIGEGAIGEDGGSSDAYLAAAAPSATGSIASAAITQDHGLAASAPIATGAIDVGEITIAGIVDLTAEGIAASGAIDSAAVNQEHNLSAANPSSGGAVAGAFASLTQDFSGAPISATPSLAAASAHITDQIPVTPSATIRVVKFRAVTPRATIVVNKFAAKTISVPIAVNRYSLPDAGTVRAWRPVVTLDGSEIAAITGTISIKQRINESAIADFVFKAPTGAIDPDSHLGKDITIAKRYRDIETGTVTGTFLLFTGIVTSAPYDPRTRQIAITCTDNLQEKIKGMTPAQIDKLITSHRHESVYDKIPESMWDYAQERLNSAAGDIYIDANGTPQFVSWVPKVTADRSYTRANIVDGTLKVARQERKNVVNVVEVELKHRYLLGWQRNRKIEWKQPEVFATWAGNFYVSSLPYRATIEAAIPDNIVYAEEPDYVLIPAGTYAGIMDVVNGEIVRLAKLILAQRWLQRCVETYKIKVKCPASIAVHGEVPNKRAYALDTDEDGIDFDKTQESKAPDPLNDAQRMIVFGPNWGYNNDGTPRVAESLHYAVMPGDAHVAYDSGLLGNQNDWVLPLYGKTATPNMLGEAQKCAIGEAVRVIVDSHRKNGDEFAARFDPLLSLADTASVNVGTHTGQARVVAIAHTLDTASGKAEQTITLGAYLPSVPDQIDDGVNAQASSMTLPTSTLSIAPPLQTHMTWAQLEPDDPRLPEGLIPPDWFYDAPLNEPDQIGWTATVAFAGTSGTVEPDTKDRFVIEFPAIDAELRDEKTYTTEKTVRIALPENTFTMSN